MGINHRAATALYRHAGCLQSGLISVIFSPLHHPSSPSTHSYDYCNSSCGIQSERRKWYLRQDVMCFLLLLLGFFCALLRVSCCVFPPALKSISKDDFREVSLRSLRCTDETTRWMGGAKKNSMTIMRRVILGTEAAKNFSQLCSRASRPYSVNIRLKNTLRSPSSVPFVV